MFDSNNLRTNLWRQTEKKDFKKWLEYLQQESWQLELIISSILLVVLTTGEGAELKSKGLLTYINISAFEKGNHTLYVEKKVDYKDSAFVNKTYEIPFVKYN